MTVLVRGTGLVLKNSGGRFLLLHLLVALVAILDVSLVWSAEITLEVDTSSPILAIESQG